MPGILLDFNQLWNFSTDFYKTSQYKIHINPSSGSRADTCGQTDGRIVRETETDRQTYGREGNRRCRDYTDTSKNCEVVYKKFNSGGLCF